MDQKWKLHAPCMGVLSLVERETYSFQKILARIFLRPDLWGNRLPMPHLVIGINEEMRVAHAKLLVSHRQSQIQKTHKTKTHASRSQPNPPIKNKHHPAILAYLIQT